MWNFLLALINMSRVDILRLIAALKFYGWCRDMLNCKYMWKLTYALYIVVRLYTLPFSSSYTSWALRVSLNSLMSKLLSIMMTVSYGFTAWVVSDVVIFHKQSDERTSSSTKCQNDSREKIISAFLNSRDILNIKSFNKKQKQKLFPN